MQNLEDINNQEIKLVIWDLDDTLWQGTLAEGDKLVLTGYVNYIKLLPSKGVMNSICSKNDYNQAKDILEKLGLWDYFVFPKIGFFSKGQAVKEILNEMHLRAENTIFIDDNLANHREVSYYNPKLKTVKPDLANYVLYFLVLKYGKDDKDLKRLKQYKLLEKKQNIQKTFRSNEEFLKSSNIILDFLSVSEDLLDRTHELIMRTNQLNFTKKRISKEELKSIINDENYISQLIHVQDNYGDYGYVGFYVLEKLTNKLIHFTFSCRIMNMGVEQFVYEYLDFPKIDLKGNTAVKLENFKKINYITVSENKYIESLPDEELFSKAVNKEYRKKILSIGACDMGLPISYLSKTNNKCYFEYPYYDVERDKRIGNIMTEHFRSCIEMPDEYKNFCKKYFINYDDVRAFDSFLFENDWDYFIWTFHDDAEWYIYKHKNYDLKVTVGWTVNVFISNLIDEDKKTKWLSDNFYKGKQITKKRFYENLEWVAEHLSPKTKVVMITCPVIEKYTNVTQALKINDCLKKFVKKHKDKFSLVEINDLIHDVTDILDYGYHLSAENAYNLYVKIINSIIENFPKDTPPLLTDIINGRKICLVGDNTFELKNAFYILNFENTFADVISYYNLKGEELRNFYTKMDDIIQNPKYSIEIKPIEEINKEEYYVIVANLFNYKSIKDLLIKKGFIPHKDFILFDNNLSANAGDIYNVNWSTFRDKTVK